MLKKYDKIVYYKPLRQTHVGAKGGESNFEYGEVFTWSITSACEHRYSRHCSTAKRVEGSG